MQKTAISYYPNHAFPPRNLAPETFERYSIVYSTKENQPPLLRGHNVKTSSKKMVDLFVQYFLSNSNLVTSDHCIPEFSSRTNAPLTNINITPSSAAKIIYNLNSSTASGPDNIPVIVL